MNATESTPFPEYLDAQQGHKKRTHRGRRSKGKGPKPVESASGGDDHMAAANEAIDAARKDPTPKGTTAHLFKALSRLKKC